MCYYLFTCFARRMVFVALCFGGAFIFSAVYVQPIVNAASALFTEDIRIEAPEINLGSVEMKKMVDELKEAGVVSGRVTFVRARSHIRVNADLRLKGKGGVVDFNSSFFGYGGHQKQAAWIAYHKLLWALKAL